MRRMQVVAFVGAVVMAGCTLGPNYQRPKVEVPDQFHGQSGPADAASITDQPWWDVFRDPTLRSLIDESLRNGYDARIAASRVEGARAQYGIAGSQRVPNIFYQGGYQTGHTSKFATPSDTSGSLIVANADVAWEIDLWGRIRRLNEAARAEYLASEEGRRGVLLSLVSDVASAYFDLRELDAQLEIARRNTAAFQDTLDLFNRRLEGGAASALETSRADASVANVAAQIPLLEREIAAKENQLNLLLGRPPGPVARGAALADQSVPPLIPAGLPSALLLRRPDVRQLEQLLIAANANVGVADAAFYPTLSLTGLLGGQSPELGTLLGSGKNWSITAGVLGPIFNGGRLRNQQRLALAQFDEARLQYEQGITNALGEVSTSLVAVQKLEEEETLRARAAKADREAVRLATLRYQSGLSAYFEVLDAMEQLLAADNALEATRHDRLLAVVALYRSLGGGWQVEETARR